MIDVGFWEVAMIGVMALIILGPERLPKVARTAGMWISKARGMMREIKADIKTEMDSEDLAELKSMGKDLRDAGDAFKSQVETADKNVKAEASQMDKAIGEALSKPSPTEKNAKEGKEAKSTPTKKPEKPKAAAKKTSKKKVSKKKASKKKVTQKKPAKKKVSKKKTSKKKVTTKTVPPKINKTSTDKAKI